MDLLEADEIQGSSYVFFLFRSVNYLMMFLGAVLAFTAVYVYFLLGTITSIEFGLICVGIFVMGLSYTASSLRDSLTGLTMYIMVTLLYLLGQLIVCLVMAASPEKAVDYILTSADPSTQASIREQVKSHIKVLQYIMGFMLLVTVPFTM